MIILFLFIGIFLFQPLFLQSKTEEKMDKYNHIIQNYQWVEYAVLKPPIGRQVLLYCEKEPFIRIGSLDKTEDFFWYGMEVKIPIDIVLYWVFLPIEPLDDHKGD